MLTSAERSWVCAQSRRIFHRVWQCSETSMEQRIHPTYVRRYNQTYVRKIESLNGRLRPATTFAQESCEQQTDTRHRRCVVGPFARKDPRTNSFAMIDSHDEEYISLNFRKYDPPASSEERLSILNVQMLIQMHRLITYSSVHMSTWVVRYSWNNCQRDSLINSYRS